MSKIIVDEIQANGGDVLTLPTTDATANNQPLVGSTSGVLSHSPLALPAADGTANKPLTTNGSGQLQFGAFPLPATGGSNGNFLGTDGTTSSWVAAPDSTSLLSGEGHVYGTMVTTTGQGHSYSTGGWSSSGPTNTYRHDNFFNDTASSTQGFNMLLGDGYPNGTSQITYAGNHGYDDQRLIQYANGNRVGWSWRDYYSRENNTSYGGLSWRVLPIRNTSNAAISINIAVQYSSYTTYNSASLGYYTPNGTPYSTVTGGTWTQLQSTTGSGTNTWATNTISVPANTTILVLLNTAHAYKTSYRFSDSSLFYNLHTTFSNSSIICDLRMLYTLHQGRTPSATNSQANPEEIYQACATIFGDR